MNNAVITVRTDKKTKDLASNLYERLGLNLSSAINMFLKQSIIKHRIPFDVEIMDAESNIKETYPEGYFNLFGAGKDLDLTEIEDINVDLDGEIAL